MDLIITIAIVVLVAAIILGSLRRGIQSVISFVLLAILATFVVIRVSGESSATANLFEGGQEPQPPQYAVPAFDDFTESVEPWVPSWIAAQTGTPQPPSGTGEDTEFGSASAGGVQPDTDIGTGSDVDGTSPGTGQIPSDPDSQGSVRAWW